jgi:subtilisin family serine protease
MILAKTKAVCRIARCTMVLILLASTLSLAAVVQYEPGEVVVKFAPQVGKADVQQRGGLVSVGIASVDEKMERYGVHGAAQVFPHKSSELGRIYRLVFDPGHDVLEVAEDFAGDGLVLYAEPWYIHQLCDVPNDTFYVSGLQWYLNTVQAPQAWDITHGDSTVVIGIVDTGVDWDHPDLWDNIWINPGEDLNGNGRLDITEWNNLDDDANGYIDDFFGWDFGGAGSADNNPMEYAAVHGTHVAGIASAVTDNRTGVAGVGWNCAIMAVKANRDGQDGIRFGYQGILYAADNGADVINLSWGNTSDSDFEREVIDSANARGAIIVASAGNDPPVSPPETPAMHYPSGYDHVIAVAATNISDRAAGWTYYGDWVDVAAPGEGIYNTWYNDIYAMLQGTSMSSPLVAGIAGLLRSVDPDMTSDEFEEKMWYTSDDIYDINPTYAGWLGGGRVNAYSALLSLTAPRLILERETTVDDAGGNQDGRPDPGETVDWVVSLSGTPTWQTAQDVWVTVSTLDEAITFIEDSTSFGNIEAGATADNSTNPFRFSVAAGDAAHWTTFYFLVEADGGSYTMADSLEMMIGRPLVLVVDDDGGDDLEEEYQGDLEGMAVVYDTWGVAESGKVSAEELMRYSVVIWLTGAEAESTLTAEDQDHLAAFLDAGNKLFLTGQNIGDELGGSTFLGDYLHVSHLADTVDFSAAPYLDGADGDIIADGDSLLLVGAEPQNSSSGVRAMGGAVDIFTYRVNPEYAAATRYESSQGYKVVYFAFGYEGIRGTGGFAPGHVLLKRIMNWFDVQTGVGQDQETIGGLPRGYSLFQNYPNPFNSETTISYHLSAGTGSRLTTLRVYNILGQEVRTVVKEIQGPGTYSIRWDGRNLGGEEVSTGVYFYRLESGDYSQTRKLVLLR